MRSSAGMMMVAALLAVGVVLGMSAAAQGAFVTPTNAWSTSYWTSDNCHPLNLINSSGLSANSPAGTHDSDTHARTMWMAGNGDGGLGGPTGTPPSVASQAVVFDLGGRYDLTGTYVWNQNQKHPTAGDLYLSRGTKDFDLYVSSDTDPLTATWTSLGSKTLAVAGGTPAEPAQWVPFAATGARLVKFDIQTAHSGLANEYVGLSEVRFDGAFAGPGVMVPNFSFQDPVMNPGGNGGPITGWTISGNSGGVFFPNGNGGLGNPLPAPAEGSQYAYLEGPNSTPTAITTTIPVAAVAADTTYTLTTAIGHRDTDIRRPDNYLIELLVDGVPVASNSLLSAHTNITPGTFEDLTASFTSPSSGGPVGGAMRIRLTHWTDDGVFRQGAFDNVRLDAEPAGDIPEPATLGLLGLAACGLGGYVRRRRKA